MKRMFLGIVLLLVAPALMLAVTGTERSGRVTLTHTISQTGDSAQIIKFHQFTARDSFDYVDSFWIAGDTTLVKFTSPATTRRLRVALDTTLTYACSVDCGTNIYGFEYVCPNGATYDLDSLIDQLTDSFNAVAGMSDSVTAEDSGTYLKVFSNFAMDRYEGAARWIFTVSSDSLEEVDSTLTTIAMVCDSMAAAINDSSTISDTLTAANDGDTVYTVTGRSGWGWSVAVGDTAQDTTLTQDSAASWSTVRDTIPLFNMYQSGFNVLNGWITIRSSKTTTKGYGSLDSAKIILYAVDGGGTRHELDSAYAIGVPMTNSFALSDVGVDTLFKSRLEFDVYVADSATDTSGSRTHDVDYWFMLVGE
jgi:hypothetical protein